MKMNKEVLSFAAIIGLLVGSVPLMAADPTASDQSQGANATAGSSGTSAQAQSQTDKKVLSELHRSNEKEIALGQLAQQQGATSAVKDYGKMLASDHQDAESKVQDVAKNQSITLPTSNPQNSPDVKKLQALSGSAFDTAFLKDMQKDHKKDIAKLQKSEQNLSADSPVRQLVAQVLPTLQKHLEKANELAKSGTAS